MRIPLGLVVPSSPGIIQSHVARERAAVDKGRRLLAAAPVGTLVVVGAIGFRRGRRDETPFHRESGGIDWRTYICMYGTRKYIHMYVCTTLDTYDWSTALPAPPSIPSFFLGRSNQ